MIFAVFVFIWTYWRPMARKKYLKYDFRSEISLWIQCCCQKNSENSLTISSIYFVAPTAIQIIEISFVLIYFEIHILNNFFESTNDYYVRKEARKSKIFLYGKIHWLITLNVFFQYLPRKNWSDLGWSDRGFSK